MRISQFQGEYWFLSNFYTPHGDLSVEHRFQAAKAVYPDQRDWVLAAPTAGEAKRRGQHVVLRPDWEQVKAEVMLNAVRAKFADSSLEEKLLATDDAELVEGNDWHDNEWGDCVCGGTDCRAPGKNRLGQFLMQVRKELRTSFADRFAGPS